MRKDELPNLTSTGSIRAQTNGLQHSQAVALSADSLDFQCYLFAVEPDGGGRVDVLVELEAVEDGGFASRVQAYHGTVVRAKIGQSVCQRIYRFFGDTGTHVGGSQHPEVKFETLGVNVRRSSPSREASRKLESGPQMVKTLESFKVLTS